MFVRPRAFVAAALAAVLAVPAVATPSAAVGQVPGGQLWVGGGCGWIRAGTTSPVSVWLSTFMDSPEYGSVVVVPTAPPGWVVEAEPEPDRHVLPHTYESFAVSVTAPADAAPGPSGVLRFDAVADGAVIATTTTTLNVVAAPAAPTGVAATADADRAVTVTWTPGPDRGLPGTPDSERRYVVTAAPGGAQATVAGETTAVVRGVHPGTAYTFTVAEWNPWGETASAPSAPVTAVAVPDRVGGVTVSGTGSSRTVSWDRPADNGSPITGYTVQAYLDGRASDPPVTVAGDTTTAEVAVEPDLDYTFAVRATNAVGDGDRSPRPGEPAPFAGTMTLTPLGGGRATLDLHDDDPTVDGWEVVASRGGLLSGSSVARESDGHGSAVVYTIDPGSTLDVRVRPYNGRGYGPLSEPVTALVVGGPGKTAISGVPVRGDGTATICFPSAWGGGAPVSGYVVESDSGQRWELSAGSRGGVLTGLAGSTTHLLSVRATTAVWGWSEPSAQVELGRHGVPRVVADVVVRRGDGVATLGWSARDEADSYQVTAEPGGAVVRTTSTYAVVRGLTNGIAYSFTIRARNHVGLGPETAAGPVTPAGVPGAVPGLTATARPGREIHVSWDPADPNGAPVTAYDVHASPYATLIARTETSRTYGWVDHDTDYEFFVSAANAVGSGPGTKVAVRSRPPYDGTPPVVAVTPRYALDGRVAVRYSAPDATQYDVRYRVARYDGDFSGYRYPAAWQGTAATSVSRDTRPGSTYCFGISARDLTGTASRWAPDACATAPLDDRSLIASAGWSLGTGPRHYGGTYSATGRPGATLRLRGVRARRLGLVVTRCPRCGVVGVFVGGVLVRRVDTAAPATSYRDVITVDLGRYRAGTLTLKALSGRLYVDGVAVVRL